MITKKKYTILSAAAAFAVSAIMFSGCTTEKGFVVSITDGKMTYEVEEEKACSVKDVFKECGIEVGEEDQVSLALDKTIQKDTEILISRLVEVTINYDGKTKKISLCGATVQDAIQEAKIPIPQKEYVNFDLDAPLEEGMEILVNKVQVKTETKEKPIHFKTVEQESAELVRGETRVSQEGVDGIKTITYKVTYVDGKVVKKKKIKSEITQEPVDEIILVGTAEPEPEPEPEEESEPERTVVSEENYDDCDGSGHGYSVITYSDGSTETREY